MTQQEVIDSLEKDNEKLKGLLNECLTYLIGVSSEEEYGPYGKYYVYSTDQDPYYLINQIRDLEQEKY